MTFTTNAVATGIYSASHTKKSEIVTDFMQGLLASGFDITNMMSALGDILHQRGCDEMAQDLDVMEWELVACPKFRYNGKAIYSPCHTEQSEKVRAFMQGLLDSRFDITNFMSAIGDLLQKQGYAEMAQDLDELEWELVASPNFIYNGK